nr:LCCL domain-containing protein [Neoroseomonas marina]
MAQRLKDPFVTLALRLLPLLAVFAWLSPAVAQDGPLPNCPDDFTGRRPGETFTCACRAGSMADGPVWGTDTYTADSRICAAARHAGLLGANGGEIVVTAARGAASYRGSTRNGVRTEDYEAYDSSFTLRPAAARTAAPQTCPENFALYRGTGEPLRCLCPGEATGAGSVWGVEVYTDDSGICQAAVHAGAIPRTGGVVTLRSLPGRDSYAGAARNGIRSSNFDAWPGSFRFEGVAANGAAPAAAAVPVQAPVAATLAARGQVQLYITFRTNSAELDASAATVLGELRAALQADPALRLTLVGHTDSTGTAAQNRPLSLRRAESVRAWLVAQGIEAGRLAVEGKGPDQPLADNASEAGRALNRRVSAIRAGT